MCSTLSWIFYLSCPLLEHHGQWSMEDNMPTVQEAPCHIYPPLCLVPFPYFISVLIQSFVSDWCWQWTVMNPWRWKGRRADGRTLGPTRGQAGSSKITGSQCLEKLDLGEGCWECYSKYIEQNYLSYFLNKQCTSSHGSLMGPSESMVDNRHLVVHCIPQAKFSL